MNAHGDNLRGVNPPEGDPPADGAPVSGTVVEDRAPYLEGLTANQEAALLALMSEPTVLKAAEKAGVASRTIYKWLESDERFARAYRAARRQTFVHAMTMTQRYAPMAIQALAKIMTDSAAPASARVSAANGILNFARDSIELDDLAERVKALEQAANPTPPPTHAMPPPTPPAAEEPQRRAA
ncbi:MAG: hypothetical protein HBSAPP03_16100 [Phycisphaerae bacterium]|nr:MAG: hypothetical protein HBSAPP03_16100 [Phycisphaerae bacterium]